MLQQLTHKQNCDYELLLYSIKYYAGRGLLFFAGGSGFLNSNQHVWQWKEEAVLSAVRNSLAQLQISLPTRFLSLLHKCAFGDGVSAARLTVFQSFCSVKKKKKSHEFFLFSCIHFPIWIYISI